MLPSRTRLFVGLGILLAAVPAEPGGAGEAPDGGEPRAGVRSDARTISGTVAALAWPQARLTVDTAEGPVALTFDRNTAVYLEDRLGSVRDLAVGTPVRASFGGDRRAVWVEVRSRPAGVDGGVPDAGAPDGGRRAAAGGEPPVLPPPSADGGTAGGVDAGSPPDAGAAPAPPGNVPAGPSPPEPNPGIAPPRPPRPGPSGPGPMPGGPEPR